MPDHLANMIAAGEVVERPSSVVKELVENSLDAYATEIRVELTAGGKGLISITDDGYGMDADDAVLAFERHATSKLVTPDELDRIVSFGFRGEALPSVASVSRIVLQTCSDDNGIGTEVIIDGGQLRTVRETGRARGTTITVRNLFYNTPARRKFLRKEPTELRHISRELTGLALGRPDIGFRLSHGGRELIECRRVGTWQERIQSLFGKEIVVRSVEMDRSRPSMRVYGLLGAPGDAGSYPEQHLLVNGRAVQSRVLRRAMGEGYEATRNSGAKPFFVLFLDIDPSLVDVNVHPQKKEIRFRNDREVFGFIADTVRESFASATRRPDTVQPAELPIGDSPSSESGIANFWYDTAADTSGQAGSVADDDRGNSDTAQTETIRPPTRPLTPKLPVPDRQEPIQHSAAVPRPGSARGSHDKPDPGSVARKPAAHGESPPEPESQQETQKNDPDSQLNLHLISPEGPRTAPATGSLSDAGGESRHLWQFQNKYIFVSTRDGIWIIDQHVAHERILFEEAMSAFAGAETTSQRLLFPVTVDLSPEQDAVLDEVMPMLESMGFSIQRLSGRSILVDAYPDSAQVTEDGALVRQMIDEVQELGFKRTGIQEQLATVYSCRAAVKAGDPLDTARMQWLIERLFNTSMPYVCPHGRPTIVKISMAELDKRFGRT